MRFLTRLPFRKPLVILATLMFLLMFARAHLKGIDIPPNAAGVASTFIGVVLAGYFASSAYEAACDSSRKEEGKVNDKNG
jgi:ABC-type sulfate transport system permease component